MITATAAIVTTAAPRIADSPIANSPSRLTTTLLPATRTARPAVSAVAMIAEREDRPRLRNSRYRVTISST